MMLASIATSNLHSVIRLDLRKHAAMGSPGLRVLGLARCFEGSTRFL